MRPLTAAALAIAGGAATGAASWMTSATGPRRGTVALFTALGIASCLAAACDLRGNTALARCRNGAIVAAVAFASAWTAAAISGNPSLAGGAAVVGGAAAAAFAIAALCRALGIALSRATFAGAAAPLALAALLFVADPFIEWDGAETRGAADRARAVVDVSPLASIASDAGVDWQRSAWLYYGPSTGAPGLSVAGLYNVSWPAPAPVWALCAFVFSLAALAMARARMSP